MATHYFCTEDAAQYGIEEAIVLQNIGYWCGHNLTNRQNIKNGRVWTYNKRGAFLEQFPYMAKGKSLESKIIKMGRILQSLENQGAIVSEQLNKSKHDRIKWYSLADMEKLGKYHTISPEALKTLKEQNCSFDTSEVFHPQNKYVPSLTDSKQQIKNTTTTEKSKIDNVSDFEKFYFCLVNVLNDMITEGGWIPKNSKRPTKSWLSPKAKSLFSRLPNPDPADCAVLVLKDWSKLLGSQAVKQQTDLLPVVQAQPREITA